MQRVRLLGELGELFGSEFVYNKLRRPADAIKVLCINRPAFKDYLLKSEENGIAFQVIQGGVDMDYADLMLPFGSNDLVIAPVIAGSGRGATKVLLGVGLIAAAVITGGIASVGVTLGGFAGIGTVGTAVATIGVGLTLTGVAELLSPQPQIPQFGGQAGFGTNNRTAGPQRVSRDIDSQSYAYLGAANTVGMGATVPVAYGQVLIGSHLLRSKLEVTDESSPKLKAIKQPGPDTILIGGEKIKSRFRKVSGAVVKQIVPYTRSKFRANPDKIVAGNWEVVFGSTKEMVLSGSGVRRVKGSIGRYTARKSKFNVCFAIDEGLFNTTGGVKVDAFITYQITVYRSENGKESATTSRLIASEAATIQGLLNKSDNYAFMHKISLPKVPDPDFRTVVVVKIVDSDADLEQTLKLTAIGFDLISS